jgi:large-conductance mechanosensitive channel
MFAALTGIGLSASAGLNAWIPLLVIGLLDRYTTLITLPSSWAWLANPWVLLILAVLLVIEMITDKVPVMDSINDGIHTFIRPTAGGIAFGSTSDAQTVTVQDPGKFLSSHAWVPIVSGAGIALVMHLMKATVRPVANTVTLGTAAPVLSLAEDITSVAMSLVAIIIPILIIVFLVAIVFVFIRLRKRMKRRRLEKRARSMTAPPPPPGHNYPGSY